jgi:anaerobic magnesium-protoporphyrin IX monomethyl ester cyclase
MRTLLTTLHSKFIHNSLALPCLVAYCGDDCGELLIREFTTHEPRESILAILLSEKPDVVAFSVYLWNRRETLDLVDALSVAQPSIKIILGGPEVSFDGPEIFASHPGITALIHGEGEGPLRDLLTAWQNGQQPEAVQRTTLRNGKKLTSGPDSPPLAQLDTIPSPFLLGLTDLQRGFVYYETSRGCPFRCSFCLSARDNTMRSFSMERIQRDLRLLMDNEVAKIKLVDRTFNYNAKRAREIFSFILQHNRSSHFHFEIAAHLLDDETLTLLQAVPKDMFQFEIGVQSTLESTLDAIDRKVNLKKLEENVHRLLESDCIHLHLDLVAGLPGDSYTSFIDSIDRVIELKPHHLQIEPVKLLPGSPLRDQAEELHIRFDPNPPYTILGSPDFSYDDLQRLQEISRLLDLTYNSGCFDSFLNSLTKAKESFAKGLVWLAREWHKRDLFRFPINRQAIYHNLAQIVRDNIDASLQQHLLDQLAYDYARSERVVINRIPDFFNTTLGPKEMDWAKAIVQNKTELIRGQGVKLQYFVCRFASMDDTVYLFLYLTQTGKKMQVEEHRYT